MAPSYHYDGNLCTDKITSLLKNWTPKLKLLQISNNKHECMYLVHDLNFCNNISKWHYHTSNIMNNPISYSSVMHWSSRNFMLEINYGSAFFWIDQSLGDNHNGIIALNILVPLKLWHPFSQQIVSSIGREFIMHLIQQNKLSLDHQDQSHTMPTLIFIFSYAT